MKGKYISTSLMLAVLAGGKEEPTILVQETKAITTDHRLIWRKLENNEPMSPKGINGKNPAQPV